MSRHSRSLADHPWLFAVEEEMQMKGNTVKILRAVDRVPAEKILASRAKAAADGKAPIAQPALLNCEMKGTLLPHEAAADLRCSVRQIYELVEVGKLDEFDISAKPNPKHRHLRVTSASVAARINGEDKKPK